jgi:glycosyltransferase involved in cell wall biosynthesis
MNISILILTKNEEQDIRACLNSVKWSDDIHIYDSMSTDDTISIAKEFGAKITQRVFDNWASHQNWGLKNISFKHPWVFYLDADERMTPELIQEIQNTVQTDCREVAFQIQRRDYFMDTWLKHVQASPFFIRLFRPQKLHYERLVNPISVVDGSIGKISGYLDHYPFSKGIDHWIDRHNSYSHLEAKQIINDRKLLKSFSLKKVFFEKNFNERRIHQKELFYRLPCRPFLKFIILYFCKRGFLDGLAGFHYAMLQSIYEYFIVLKTRELEKKIIK